MHTTHPDPKRARALRKFRAERLIGRYIANPLIKALGKAGVTTSFATELETTGRRSGRPRIVPVSAKFDDRGAWLISQHGMRSGWALNISEHPAVRIRHNNVWRNAAATFEPGDDVVARSRTFAPNPALAALTAATFRALQSDPISVRVTFTDAARA